MRELKFYWVIRCLNGIFQRIGKKFILDILSFQVIPENKIHFTQKCL